MIVLKSKQIVMKNRVKTRKKLNSPIIIFASSLRNNYRATVKLIFRIHIRPVLWLCKSNTFQKWNTQNQ